MRQRDLELLDSYLKPLHAASDRHESEIRTIERTCDKMWTRVKDIERDNEAHKTSIAQGLASVRSLLQRANRARRDVEAFIDDDDQVVVDTAGETVNVEAPNNDALATARAKRPGRTVL